MHARPTIYMEMIPCSNLLTVHSPAFSELRSLQSHFLEQASLKPVVHRPRTAMAGWSSLPADLINRVADRLLATDDLDYYMDLRAVCRGWRSSTADPKNDSARFRPRQWVMLDEVHQSDARLFVNPATGRFVRKDLPVLRRYFVVAGADGGSVVLADRTAPHAARVLNPFTGAMVSFEAPVPPDGKLAAHVIGSSPTLVLLCQDSRTIYFADPDSESFIERKEEQPHPLVWVALQGGIYNAAARAREGGGPMASLLAPFVLDEANKILDLADEPFAQYFSGGGAEGQPGTNNRCFLVESAGEMLIVVKLPHRVEVFRIDTGRNLLERVKNLGSRALFVGDYRCLSVVRRVRVQPRGRDGSEGRWRIDSLNPVTVCVDPPFSEVQLLCCYAFEARHSQLGWQQIISGLERFSELVRSHPEVVDGIVGYGSEADDFSDIEDLI